MLKGIIEYYPPKIDEWQLNDVDMDAMDAFCRRCYKASRLAILDLYLDHGMFLGRMPFSLFILKLASEKQKPWACEFELLKENSDTTKEMVDEEIVKNLQNSQWETDNIELINGAFATLEMVKAPLRKK